LLLFITMRLTTLFDGDADFLVLATRRVGQSKIVHFPSTEARASFLAIVVAASRALSPHYDSAIHQSGAAVLCSRRTDERDEINEAI